MQDFIASQVISAYRRGGGRLSKHKVVPWAWWHFANFPVFELLYVRVGVPLVLVWPTRMTPRQASDGSARPDHDPQLDAFSMAGSPAVRS